MEVSFHSTANKVFTYHTTRFAEKTEEQAADSRADGAQLTISKEGQEALVNNQETTADKIAAQLGAMTREDFMAKLEQWRNENVTPLKGGNPYESVDPDGSIANAAYFESYIGQLMERENTIKSYYSGAYDEAVAAPVDSLVYISGKYIHSWSDYFDSSMPVNERKWAHRQLWAMLTDAHVALNDPYALASAGGPKSVKQMDEIARQAVKDKLDSLLEEAVRQGEEKSL